MRLTSANWMGRLEPPVGPLAFLDRVALAVGSVGGAGYAPVAPGSAGSLVAAAGIWLIPFTPTALVVAIVVVSLLAVWAGSRVERLLGATDPGVIVVDEVAGMLVSVLWLPRTLPVLFAAFVLFRLFDVWKPFPARQSQALPGGFGVVVDDLIAGAYAMLAIHVARALFAAGS